MVLGVAAAAAFLGDERVGRRRQHYGGVRPFVNRIETYLEQSAEGRRDIRTAVRGGFNCSISLREAGRRIESVADNRQSILQQLGTLQAPTGQADDIVTLLHRALFHSIEADRHYRDGFLAVAEGKAVCPLPPDPNFRLGAEVGRSCDGG